MDLATSQIACISGTISCESLIHKKKKEKEEKVEEEKVIPLFSL